MLHYITWNASPEIFSIGPLTVRWYGLLFGLAIFSAWIIVTKIFKHEKRPEIWSEKLFMYGAIGLVVGARLGHCFFYEWEPLAEPIKILGITFTKGNHYFTHPWELLYVWKGGLSSHGGAIGLLVAMYFYSKNVTHKDYIWIFDRLVIGVALGGALIRFGNLMNSEIYGGATTLPWGFKFINDMGNCVGSNPCYDWATTAVHPTQIYEMIYCLVTFAVCMWLYWKKDAYQKRGLIFGVFLIGIFLSRFFLEFIKLNQGAFEQNLPLNMGQILSIPFFITGFVLLYRALR